MAPTTKENRRVPNPAERRYLLEKLRRELKGDLAEGWRHPYSADEREHIRDGLFFTEDPRWKFKFSFMLGLSVTIAVMGLLSDSTAVVIGAMLVAPLMTPVLGLSYCISAAWGSKISASIRRVSLATVGSIAWAAALAFVFNEGHDQAEVIARTAPSFKDLIVGLAAGGAGAYATLRDDGSAALPGVGVAVALVPPLAVVGIMLEAGEPGLAGGAFLLYMANLGSILLSAIAVWIGSGFVTQSRLKSRPWKIVLGVGLTLALTFGVSFFLAGRTQQQQREAERTAETAIQTAKANEAVSDWLASSEDGAALEIVAVSLPDDADVVKIQLVGSGGPPAKSDLVEPLSKAYSRPITPRVLWTLQTERSDEPEALPPPTDEELAIEEIAPLITTWLDSSESDAEFKVRNISIDGAIVSVDLAGASLPPPVEPLEASIVGALGEGYFVEVLFAETIRAGAPDQVDADEPDESRLVAETARVWISAISGATDPDRQFDLQLVDAQVLTNSIVIDLAGDSAPAQNQIDELQASVIEAVGFDADVVVRFTERQTLTLTTASTSLPDQ